MENYILITENKKALLPIVISCKATELEKFAAEELGEYLTKVTGAAFETVTDDCFTGQAIYVGYTDYAELNGMKTTGEEQWYIKADQSSLLISGGTCATDRGLLYGVYHFLEDYLGIRWWNEWEEYVPERETVSVPSDYFLTGEPEIKLRQISTRYCVRDLRFVARSRNHGDIPKRDIMGWGQELTRKTGGFVYSGGPRRSHTMSLYIPASEYFEAHPDWFAWDETYQERNPGGQLCLSNEEVVEEMTRKVLEAVEQDDEVAEQLGINKPTSYGVTLGDFGYHCQCRRCRESVEKSGMMGHILKFINSIARKVAEKSPGTMLDTPAYSAYRDIPRDDTVPEKNVYIRLADVYTDILHGLKHRHNAVQKKNLLEWARLCRENGSYLNVQDYYMYQYPYYPLPMLFKLEENFRLYHEYGINGVFIESHEEMENGLWTMQNWLIAKLMETPTADFQILLNDFIYKYYGAAGEAVKKYLYLLHETCEKYEQRVVLHYSTTHTNYIDLDVVLQGYELLSEALDCVKDNPEQIDRVKILRADLDKVIAVRFDDFKRLAGERGVELPVKRCEAADRALEVYDILDRKFAYPQGDVGSQMLLSYGRKTILAHRENAQEIALPTGLEHRNPKDVYQIDVSKLLCFDEEDGMFYQRGQMAFNVEDEDAVDGIAQRLDYDRMGTLVKRKYTISGRNDHVDNPLRLDVKRTSVMKDNNPYYTQAYYREDLRPDEYALYSLRGICNVSADSDYTFTAFGPKEITLDLSAVSIVFPAEEYDVSIRVKFTGEAFGGRKEQPNAIYLDRIYIVRVK